MKMFQLYKWDCIIRWVLFGLAAFIWILYGMDFISSYPVPLSGVTLLLYLIPVHLILWLISIIVTIKNKKIPAIIFSCIAPIVSIAFLFFLIIIHVGITGGV